VSIHVCVCMSVCGCVCVCERDSVCVHVRTKEIVCVRLRKFVCMRACKRYSFNCSHILFNPAMCVFVFVAGGYVQREREREQV